MPTAAQVRAELVDANSPLASQYAPLIAVANDQAVADLLNLKQYRGLVPLREFAAACLQLNLTGGVLALLEIPIGAEIAPGVTMTIPTKAMLHQVITLVQNDYRLEVANVDDPQFGPACDGLIAMGLLTSEGKSTLIALGNNRSSRASVLWGEDAAVSAGLVGEARNG